MLLAAGLGWYAGRHEPLDDAAREPASRPAAASARPGSPTAQPSPTPARPPALAPLPGGRVLASPDPQHFLVLRYRETDPPETGRLEIESVYTLRRDPQRFLRAPNKRAPHGHYLDDLGAERAAELERAQARLQREAASGALDPEADARLADAARRVLALGDATALEALLTPEHPPSVRRTIAAVLVEAGFRSAAPVLAESLDSQVAADRERAAALLQRLAGRPIPDRESFEHWWVRLHPAEREARVELPAEEPPR
ncbi:MAG: hypothetical protein D6776_09270 [Planctomycetota bacterium]|nr:MAG: hypothetical protein D6776_09270 [Planctomycetota bacterium]